MSKVNCFKMDPISDMFIRIKNAQKAGQESVQIPYSKFKHEIAKVLEREGWIRQTERKGKRIRKFLEIQLIYKEGQPLVREVKLISKPSRRIYASRQNLPKPHHGGLVILTTSKGVMSSGEASKAKIGGQILAEVW